jgi:hypothetical protein
MAIIKRDLTCVLNKHETRQISFYYCLIHHSERYPSEKIVIKPFLFMRPFSKMKDFLTIMDCEDAG